MADKPHTAFPYEEFMQLLRDQGYRIGVDSYLQVQQLTNRLPAGTPRDTLRHLLCPIFAKSEKEQARFYRLFDNYFDEHLRNIGPRETPTTGTRPIRIRRPVIRADWLALGTYRWIFLTLALLLSALAVYLPWRVYLAVKGTQDRIGAVDYLRRYDLDDQGRYAWYLVRYVANEVVGMDQPCDGLEALSFDYGVAAGEGRQLEVQFIPLLSDTTLRYTWSIDDSIYLRDTYRPSYTFADTGTHMVGLRAENAFGCSFEVLKKAKIRPPQTCFAGFAHAAQPGNDRQLLFSDTSLVAAGDEIERWVWDFGDDNNTQAYTASASFEFQSYRTYRVCLDIRTRQGCSSSYCKVIRLEDPRRPPDLLPLALMPPAKVEIPFDPSPFAPYYPLIIGIVLLVVGVFYELYRLTKRQLDRAHKRADQGPFTWPLRWQDPNPVVPQDSLFRIATHLRQRQESDIHILDMPATIEATMLAGGYPTFSYQPGTRPSEYLFLIERQSPRDHVATFWGDLTTKLAAQDVFIQIYHYPPHLGQCYRRRDERPAQLEDLRIRFPDHRVVIIGEGDGMLDAVVGEFAAENYPLLGWKDRVLMSTRPPATWSMQELNLAQHYVLVPARTEVLERTLDYLAMDRPPSPSTWKAKDSTLPPDPEEELTLGDLCDYLGDDLYNWLAACAVYPELHYDLTMRLGRELEVCFGYAFVNEENMRRLFYLPYFRSGSIPDELRTQLVDELDPQVRKRIHAAVLEVLAQNPPPKGSYAAERVKGHMTLQRWGMAAGTWNERRKLSSEIETMVERNEIEDPVMWRHLERDTGGIAEGRVPERLRAMLFRQGIPALGFSGWLRISVMLAVILGLFLYVFQVRLSWKNLGDVDKWITRTGSIVEIDGNYYRLKNNRDSALYFSYQGQGYYANSDYGSAYNNFAEAIGLDPFNPVYYYQRGMANIQLNRRNKQDSLLRESRSDFALATALTPIFTPATRLEAIIQQPMPALQRSILAPDGQHILTAEGSEAILYRRNNALLIPLQRFAHDNEVALIDLSRDGRYVLTTAGSQTLLWDAATGERLGELTGHNRPVFAARFSANGNYVLTAADDNLAILWNRRTRAAIHTFEFIHTDGLRDVDITPDNRYIVTASIDSTAALWDRSTGQFIANLDGHGQPLLSARFMAGGQMIMTSASDGSLMFWNLAGDSLLRIRLDHPNLRSNQLAPDGSMLATGFWDGSGNSIDIMLWDYSRGTTLIDLSTQVPTPVPNRQVQARPNARMDMYERPGPEPGISFSDDCRYLLVSVPGWGILLFESRDFIKSPLKWQSAYNQAVTDYELRNFTAAIQAFDYLIGIDSVNLAKYYGRGLASLYQADLGTDEAGLAQLRQGLGDLRTVILRDSTYRDSLRRIVPFAGQIFNRHPEYNPLKDEVCREAETFLRGICEMLQFDEILPYTEGLAAVRRGSYWGYVDSNRFLFIEPQYTDAQSFVNGLAMVRSPKLNRYILIDRTGTIACDIVETPSEGLAAVRDARTGKWGYLDKESNQFVIEARYDEAESFYRGYAKVKQGRTFGLIDHAGDADLYGGFVYSRIEGNFRINNELQSLRNGRVFIIRYIPPERRVAPRPQPLEELQRVEVTPPQAANPGTIVVVGGPADGLRRAMRAGRYGYVRADAQAQQTQMPNQTTDPTPEVVIEFQYENALDFSADRGAVKKPGGKWGYIDPMGKAVIPFEFDEVQVFVQEGAQMLALVSRGGQQYYIDRSGQCVPWKDRDCPGGARDEEKTLSTQESYVDKPSGLTVFKENGKWGLRAQDGTLVSPAIYANPINFVEGYARVQRFGRWGFIDTRGQVRIRIIYEDAQDFSDGLAAVRLVGKWGYIDIDDKRVIPFQYDAAKPFVRGKAIVRDGERSYTIDRDNNLVGGRKY
ncbi:MAG: hypothetical protein OHK0039_34470 [Bacteroidia bacterium]